MKKKFSVREVYGVSDFAYREILKKKIPAWKRIFLSVNEIRIKSLEVDLDLLRRQYNRLRRGYKAKKSRLTPEQRERLREIETEREELMEEISHRILKKKEAIERIRNFR